MPDFSIKANDRLPPIEAQLTHRNGGAIDLTNALSVAFIMRRPSATAPKVSAPAEVVNPLFGIVRYNWAAADTNTPADDYQGEWEITWADGRKQTAPTIGYHSIAVNPDLNNS